MASFNSIASFSSSAKTNSSVLSLSLNTAATAATAKSRSVIPSALTPATLPPATRGHESGTVIKGVDANIFGGKNISWAKLFSNVAESAKILEPSVSGKFRTQSGAANYIADSTSSYGNGARADKLVQDAVRDASNRWKPGMDLQGMIKDAVKKALTGVLPESVPPTGGFRGPKTPAEVANMAASFVHANGNDPISAAEKMVYNDRHPAPPPH